MLTPPKSPLKIALLIAGLFLVVYLTAFPSDTIRYRVTVTVETPEGLKTGSAVRQAYKHHEERILPGQGGTIYGFAKGEAAFVDLGKRGVLFLLLGGQDESERIFSDFSNVITRKVTWPIEQSLMFVTFRDLKDPKTIQNILEARAENKRNPNRKSLKIDHTAEIFGQGVKIKEVVIERTGDPVSTGLMARLPWLPQYYTKMFDGQRYNTIHSSYPFANSLNAGAFSTEARYQSKGSE